MALGTAQHRVKGRFDLPSPRVDYLAVAGQAACEGDGHSGRMGQVEAVHGLCVDMGFCAVAGIPAPRKRLTHRNALPELHLDAGAL